MTGAELAIGWLTIAAFVVVAGVALHPSARAAERFAARNFNAGSPPGA